MSAAPVLRASTYWGRKHRRSWRSSFVNGIANPLLYLLSMGVLLGRLVDSSGTARPELGGGSYLQFVVPGLLASTAMQVAANESLFPVITALQWDGVYDTMSATPLTPAEVFAGHFGYALARVLQSAVLFLAVAGLAGAVPLQRLALELPAAVLVGAAFAAPLMAFAMYRGDNKSFNPISRFVLVPLFLASGIFFSVDRYPLPLRVLVWLSPLTHGAQMCRQLSRGTIDAALAGHAAYLCALAAAGVLLARHAYRRRLAA